MAEPPYPEPQGGEGRVRTSRSNRAIRTGSPGGRTRPATGRVVPVAAVTALLAIALSLLAGCTGGDSHRFRVEEVEGVRTVRTTGGPRFPGELFTYEEILTLHQDPTVPGSVLTRPAILTRDGSGAFYVADTGSNRISVFDAGGRFVRTLGSAGEGPGQWMNLLLQGIEGGVVHTIDFARGRLIRYRSGGELLEEVMVPIEWRSGTYGLYPLPDQRMVMLNLHDAPDGPREAIGMVLTDRMRRHWSVATGRFDESSPAFPCARYFEGLGIVLSTGLNGRLDVYPVDGSAVHRIEVAGLTEPAWACVGRDDRGYWWLRVPDEPEAGEGGSARWRLLSPEGEWLGETRTPELAPVPDVQSRLLPVSVAGDLLMGVRSAPGDDRYEVVVWRMMPAVEGFIWP